jgi:hypothetical protein
VAVECKRRLEAPTRLTEVADVLREEPEVVVVHRDATRVADPLAKGECLRVTLASLSEIAAIRADVRERPDGVGFDANVADRGSRLARTSEVHLGAIEPTFAPQAGADVAKDGADASRIIDRDGPRERTAPESNRRKRPVASVRRDACASNAVHPHLSCAATEWPRRKSGDFTDEKGVGPGHGIRVSQSARRHKGILVSFDRAC